MPVRNWGSTVPRLLTPQNLRLSFTHEFNQIFPPRKKLPFLSQERFVSRHRHGRGDLMIIPMRGETGACINKVPDFKKAFS